MRIPFIYFLASEIIGKRKGERGRGGGEREGGRGGSWRGGKAGREERRGGRGG